MSKQVTINIKGETKGLLFFKGADKEYGAPMYKDGQPTADTVFDFIYPNLATGRTWGVDFDLASAKLVYPDGKMVPAGSLVDEVNEQARNDLFNELYDIQLECLHNEFQVKSTKGTDGSPRVEFWFGLETGPELEKMVHRVAKIILNYV